MQKYIVILRICIGLIFIMYGSLKFFCELSPAEDIAINTIDVLFLGLIPKLLSIKLLAIWEVIIGITFVFAIYIRIFVILFITHMIFTFSPLFIFPELCFLENSYSFTLLGQYIVKNIVFIAAGILIYKNEKVLE